MGGYERDVGALGAGRAPAGRRPGRLQRAPARRGLAALRGDRGELAPAGAGDGRDHRDPPDQRARGVHSGQRVLPRRERGARASSSRPASAPTAWRAPAGSARRWPSGSRRASPRWTCGRWTSAASARISARPATRSSGPRRSTRPTTTSATPATSARPDGHCGPRAPTPGTPSMGPPSARSPAGSGSTGTSPTRRRATSRCVPAAGRGCTGRPRSARSTARTREQAGLFDESSFAKLEIAGPGAAGFLEGLCDNRVARDVGRDHLHADAQPPRRHRVRLHRHPGRGGAVLDRHGDRLRQPRPQLDPPARPGGRQRPLRRRDGPLGLLRAVGTAGAARSSPR